MTVHHHGERAGPACAMSRRGSRPACWWPRRPRRRRRSRQGSAPADRARAAGRGLLPARFSVIVGTAGTLRLRAPCATALVLQLLQFQQHPAELGLQRVLAERAARQRPRHEVLASARRIKIERIDVERRRPSPTIRLTFNTPTARFLRADHAPGSAAHRSAARSPAR